MVRKQHMRFPVLAVVLLAVTFILGGAAGAFMYAAGEEVLETPKMAMVSHTEYAYNAPGQIIARLVNFQGDPVSVTNCTATILYPDKTSFVSAALMTASNIPGDHYYNFTTPVGPEGTYEYQAVCYYGVNKNASVTNSFHLTPNFNNVLSNLTYIESQLDAVQGNLTQLSSELFAVNASLSGEIAGLSSQLNANTTQILTAISDVNSSLYQAIMNITPQVNITPILDAITALDAAMAGNFTATNALIVDVNTTTQSSFTVVNDKLDVMNTTLNANNAYLVLINATTTDTYDYVTGMLATNVGNILTQLGVINATVNRIETTTSQINSTTNTILQNQQDAVSMQVFSG